MLFLFEYGYTADEVEAMLLDHSILHTALNEIKFDAGESLSFMICRHIPMDVERKQIIVKELIVPMISLWNIIIKE